MCVCVCVSDILDLSSPSLAHVEPKLSKYGIMITIKNDLEYPQSISPEWEPDASIEQKTDHEETFLHTNHQITKTRKARKTGSLPTCDLPRSHTQSDNICGHQTNQAEPMLPSNHNSKKSHGLYDATGGDEISHLEEIMGASPPCSCYHLVLGRLWGQWR